jgi:hypothetical protein
MNRALDPTGGSSIPLSGAETLWADTTQLYASAYAWEWDISLAVGGTQFTAETASNSSHYFGVALKAVGEAHDSFMTMAADLLQAGATNAAGMGAAIRATADDFVKTDSGAAGNADRVRNKL